MFELTGSGLERHEPASFAELGVRERDDLQRLLRDDIAVLDEDLLVIAEEFGQWEDARRRIDLLAVDKQGRLVVIELKRTETGGHMDLQALRYAAMVSSMSFEDVRRALAGQLAKVQPDDERDAEAELTSFLETPENEEISSEVRILLIAADFGRELTTTVLWLNELEGMDIRCIRVVPYRLGEKTLLHIDQVVPLPETTDYQVRLRRKEKQRDQARTDGRDFTRYHIIVDGEDSGDRNKRHAVREMVQRLVDKGVPASALGEVLGPARFLSVTGELHDENELLAAFAEAKTNFDPARWFFDAPFRQEGRTWLLRKQWGRNTEPTLQAMGEAFPESGVAFRVADA